MCQQFTAYSTKYAQSLLCFILFSYIISVGGFIAHLPISFKVASLLMGQSYDCPNASEATLKNMYKSDDLSE